MSYVIKADITHPEARQFSFRAAKTMYGGKGIRAKLCFKFYRQSPNNICGIPDETAAFLREFF